MAVRMAALVIGVAVTAWTLAAMVKALLIPRGRPGILARSVHATVRTAAMLPLRALPTYQAQDRWLAGMGPVTVIAQLVAYAVMFILGLGLVVYGVTDLSLGDSLYQSGATFTTLGIVEPVNVPSIVTTFVAAFLGLVAIAVFIGYLMGTYSAYAAREAQMARIAMFAGEPAWGPQVLARAKVIGLPDEQAPDAASWVDWITTTRMNTAVNASLADFRSTSPWRHWSTTLLAVLDAAALRLALDPAASRPQLVQLLTEGAASLRSMADRDAKYDPRVHNWIIESEVAEVLQASTGRPSDQLDCGITRAEFDDALAELAAVGMTLPADRDGAWARFAAVRSTYAAAAMRLARAHHAVRSPWSGERTPEVPVTWPMRAGRR